jgi:Secretion system C-terminal sorting domain
MKKLFTILFVSAMSTASFAQQLPNVGFENWTNFSPNSWGTLDGAFGGLGAYRSFGLQDTTVGNFNGGKSAVKLSQDSTKFPPIFSSLPGILYLGKGAYKNGVVTPSFPYTKRPDTLFLAYKVQESTNNDTCSMTLVLTNGASVVLGGKLEFKNVSNTWQNIYVPLQTLYSSSNNPDTLRLLFTAGQSPSRLRKASLWIDDVYFNAAVTITGIADAPAIVNGVNAYPNPANSTVTVRISQDEIGSPISLYDAQGREVYQGILNSENHAIDTRNLVDGIYSIRVLSVDHITRYNGKISIAH